MTEHKSYPVSDFKTLTNSDEPGTFEALAAVFGNIDHDGDRIHKGAFADTLASWKARGRSIPILWSHNPETPPIGVVTDASEINAGLKIKARLLIDDNPGAKAVHAAMKAGALAEFSFGYAVPEGGAAKTADGGRTVRELKRLDLFEVSPVFRGANPATQLRGVKTADTRHQLDQVKADLERQHRRLQELGEQTAEVPVKTLADELRDVIASFDPVPPKPAAKGDRQPKKEEEQSDNPEPNPAGQAGEEAKARINRLLMERPIHQEVAEQ